MKRALIHLAAVAVVAAGAIHALADDQPPSWTGLRAGVAVVDATWHVGAGAGQYASDNIPTDASDEWDPSVQHVKQASSYGVASRLSIRAIVMQDGKGDAPVALVKDDNYLAQDMLVRRVAQILAADGSKVTYDNILLSATHDHNSPYYSTPSWGVWLFQDVMDLRMFEYQARRMAAAIEQAEASMVPARVGGTTVQFSDFQGNIAGSDRNEDGSPTGYPLWDNDHGLVVLRFDNMTDPAKPTPLATYVNYAEHGESLDGFDLISADWLAPFQRYVDAATGVPMVFSQGSVGSAEGPYDYGNPKQGVDQGDAFPEVYGHMGYAQAERGTHLMAERVVDAWNAIGGADNGVTVQVPTQTDPTVKMITHWVAGPLSHPYPSVGNCRSDRGLEGDPGAPAAGLPDCERLSDVGAPTPLFSTGLYDQLRQAGIPVPSNYDAPSHGAVEENLRIKLQAVSIGDILLASCSCEAQSDLIKNIESRTDAAASDPKQDPTMGDEWHGFDYASQANVNEGWPGMGVKACFAEYDAANQVSDYSCPDPRDRWGNSRVTMPPAAFAHMEHEINNDAAGWNDPSYVAQAGSEPTDVNAINGNFSYVELGANVDGFDYSKCTGYPLTIGLGHTGDYDGYTVTYREYMARDAYRKALTSYGPHTGDYMATNLVGMAANLRCGTPVMAQPTDPLAQADEQRQQAEATFLGQISSAYYDGWAAQLPTDGGAPSALAQPKDITRFDAAQFRWVGGDNWTDNPTVSVQGLDDNGTWHSYDQSGEVQVFLDNPATSAGDFGVSGLAGEQVNNRAGTQEWHWRASFEAFDSYPRADVTGGQIPSGTYRFVVTGQFNGPVPVGAVKCNDLRTTTTTTAMGTCYQLTSDPFRVSPWQGVTVDKNSVKRDGTTLSFTVVDNYPQRPADTDGIRYYAAEPDIAGGSHLCTNCTFRPWASHGGVGTAIVTVQDGLGQSHDVAATCDAGWHCVAKVPAGLGITFSIRPGRVIDSYGESNGQAIPINPA